MARDFELSVLPQLGRLRRRALNLTRNHFDADDLVQETLLRATRFWRQFQTGTNLLAWLHRIMFNAFVSERRGHRIRTQWLALRPHETSVPDGEVLAHAHLFSAMDDHQAARWKRLPARDRRILRLVHGLELSYEETARSLNCPLGTVMSRLHRARRALRGPSALESAIGA